jgi:hypothetical protein
MKQFFLLFLLLATTTLFASQKSVIKTICLNGDTKEFQITVDNQKLHLTVDAVQDNLGGYVDIPENWYYLKVESKVYHIGGVVDNENQLGTNRFSTYISFKEKNKSLDLKKLYSLKDNTNLQIIQKINLETSNKAKISKTILDVYFDKKQFEQEYKKCTN